MIRLLFAVLAVVAGMASALQGATNAALTARVGLAPALLTNAGVLLAGSLGLWAVRGAPTSTFAAASSTPWLYCGGLLGFTIVAVLASSFPRLGGALTIGAMVLGQGLCALAIDHFGLLGMPEEPITLARLIGVVMLCGGALLLRY